MRKFSFWDDWLLLSRLSNDIFTLEVQHFLQRESAFEMSTYLKLEMTLTYSSHFTSLHQGRGGAGAVNSQNINTICRTFWWSQNQLQWQFQEQLFVRWISLDHHPFLLHRSLHGRFTIPGWPEATLFCCSLWFSLSLATLIYGRKERRWEDQRTGIWMTDLITWNNCRCSIRRRDRSLLALSQQASDTCL